jgi:hypothetical protein
MMPIPPAPSLSSAAAGGIAAGAIVAAVALGLWGRLIHRGALVALGVAAGLAVGPAVADRLGTSVRLTQGVAAGTLAVAGLALARLVWAGILAALAGGIPLGVLLRDWLREGSEAAKTALAAVRDAGDLGAWAWAWLEAAWALFKLRWSDDQGALLLIGVPAAVVLLIGLIRSRLAAILMTSLLAGVLLVGGGVLGAFAVRGGVWASAWSHLAVLAIGAGAIALLALTVQYRGAVRSDRRRREAEPKKAETPAKAGADEDDDGDD